LSDSVCGRDAGWLARLAAAVKEMLGRPTVGLMKIPCVPGKNGHRLSRKLGPESDGMEAIAQWCFPSRRQHAGSFDSVPEKVSAGLISAKLKRAINRAAGARRIVRILLFNRKIRNVAKLGQGLQGSTGISFCALMRMRWGIVEFPVLAWWLSLAV